MIDLMRCPFCGGAGKEKYYGYNVTGIGCIQCGCHTDGYEDPDVAIKAWNRRACPWISPKDKLPDNDTVVLVKSIGKNTGEHYYGVVVFSAKYKQFYRFIGIQDENITDYVIYWAEIPESPEEDK